MINLLLLLKLTKLFNSIENHNFLSQRILILLQPSIKMKHSDLNGKSI